ncbi:hypothetical protein emiel_12 [Salmonella phage emiel]|uniref:Uncharacterized protein n=1 Tax=Salmonella phage emiel TaxID=2713295 RepID=A0A6G8R9Z9_9CAUD|nr:hypothetical protein emiel_12 [Salmonella phage emiel]
MPLVKFTTVDLANGLPPKAEQKFLTVEEWNIWCQSALKAGAKRTNGGKVFTRFNKECIIVVQVMIE